MRHRRANERQLIVRWLCLVIFTTLLSLNAGKCLTTENSLTSYTKQLIDLMGLFERLDQATAERMAANERYLMAKAMLRLSGGFYQLEIAKGRLVNAALRSIERDNRGSPDMDEAAVRLQSTLDCLTAQLHKDGPCIGAFVGFDGPSVTQIFEVELEKKHDSVGAIIRELGFDSTTPPTPRLQEAIVEDAKAAREAAHALYMKTAEFAHVLDPSVIPPEHPYCERPSP